jgi:hypothetical protein
MITNTLPTIDFTLNFGMPSKLKLLLESTFAY